MILEQLKSTTAAAHASVEQRLRIAQRDPTLSDYRNYLRAMYGFTAPLEQRLRRLPATFAREVELEQRCKAQLIDRDLAALDQRFEGGPDPRGWCDALPPSESPAQAMGTLYVLEGSTLGARWLLRHLRPLGIDDCSAYLSSYGDVLGPMWEKMRAALVRYTERYPEHTSELLAAARETFRALDEWFVRCRAAEASAPA